MISNRLQKPEYIISIFLLALLKIWTTPINPNWIENGELYCVRSATIINTHQDISQKITMRNSSMMVFINCIRELLKKEWNGYFSEFFRIIAIQNL